MKWNDILAIPKRNNMARAYSTVVVLVGTNNRQNVWFKESTDQRIDGTKEQGICFLDLALFLV